MDKHRSRATTEQCLPVNASSEDPLSVVLSKDDSDGASVARHLRALAHHKLDQAPTPHQQAAILCPTQHLQAATRSTMLRYLTDT